MNSEDDVMVTFPGPVTAENWDMSMAILNAMKPAILAAETSSQKDPGKDGTDD